MNNIYRNKDDTLEAEKIYIEARNIHKNKKAVHGTSAHRKQIGKLEGNAKAIILKPLRIIKR